MGFQFCSEKKVNKGIGDRGSENMKKAVWSTLLHKISMDENPQHQNCPEGVENWCKWQRAVATGQLEHFKDDPSLNSVIQNVIRPIYEDVSNNDLLKRCLGGNTQNNNETFITSWKRT
ncbi:PREDICTED: uncharacterized protein LOC106742985 [Dinoponera quadriceps]|uniref:Uncharacterized protein LOC106742985 n=1 Tax=Dinoponera quadriceps TaxID=609295 RepID=A0A6P3X0J5_DINQU|nr:PREDICTED: uncharacterized protein LOC106742985 [Dinoponera quadriceps]